MVQRKKKGLPEGRTVFDVLFGVGTGLVTVQARVKGSPQPGGKLPRTTVKLKGSSTQATIVKLERLAMRMPLPTEATVVGQSMHTAGTQQCSGTPCLQVLQNFSR